MKGTKIDFQWIEKGKEHHKLLNRQDLYVVFEGLAKGFEDDNEISKVFIKRIIPYADKIIIDKDYNSTQTIPFIVYQKGDIKNVLKIIRYHKIVWAILNKYCTE